MLDQFYNLISEAYYMPRGEAKIALLEEAIRLADSHLGTEQRFEARMELVDVATFSGHGEKAVMAFAWCLAQYDKDPSLAHDEDMMWSYKYVLDRLLLFPDIELTKVEETLGDLKKRFTALGYGPQFYYYIKTEIALRLDNKEEAEFYYEKWIKESSDILSDCRACDLANQTKLLLALDRTEEAKFAAEKIFKENLYCNSVPHRTYADFLLPLLKENRIQEAADYFQKSYQLVYNKNGYLEEVAKHLEYLVVADTPKAIQYIEKYLPEVVQSAETSIKYCFYRAAVFLFDALDGRQVIQLPDSITPERIKQELIDIAKICDERNKTNIFFKKINQFHAEMQELKSILYKEDK